MRNISGTSIAFGLTVAFGLTLGLLGVLGYEAIGMVAAIGGIAIAAVWLVALFTGDRRAEKGRPRP